jgi:hypothetical protein
VEGRAGAGCVVGLVEAGGRRPRWERGWVWAWGPFVPSCVGVRRGLLCVGLP